MLLWFFVILQACCLVYVISQKYGLFAICNSCLNLIFCVILALVDSLNMI